MYIVGNTIIQLHVQRNKALINEREFYREKDSVLQLYVNIEVIERENVTDLITVESAEAHTINQFVAIISPRMKLKRNQLTLIPKPQQQRMMHPFPNPKRS